MLRRPFSLFAGVVSILLLGTVSSGTVAQVDTQTDIQPAAPISPATPSTNSNISFRRPLRINNIRVFNDSELRRSEYHFVIDFPADAVEPLEKLTFEQIEGAGYPRYRDSGSYAFDSAERTPLPLSRLENNRDERTITVEFDPPVEPGRQVTVALKARNPRSGIYVYQFTAFPVGATEGQYAGVDRFSISEPFRRRFRY